MLRSSRHSARQDLSIVEVKSKFDAEFRRFSLNRNHPLTYEEFQGLLGNLHSLRLAFVITYIDPDEELLPINNNDNFHKALSTAKPLLRLIIQKKGDSENGYGTLKLKKSTGFSKILSGFESESPRPAIPISLPGDFRRVSAIIDVDIVPETHRRVKLMKNGTDKPLGFYIRDGSSVRVLNSGLEKVAGIFISRLVPGGLAESTGLLAVNDEVLEVNGIEVSGKTLDQVTDMMVANSMNLIITVKPVNQRNNISPRSRVRQSQKSSRSAASSSPSSAPSADGSDEIVNHEDDDDEVRDLMAEQAAPREDDVSELNTTLEGATIGPDDGHPKEDMVNL